MKPRFSTEDVLRGLSPPVVPMVERLLEEAQRAKRAIYLVGGPVRDLVLERPIRDVDLLVESSDLGSAGDLARRAYGDRHRIVVHQRFGTVHVEGPGGGVDLATSRRETYSRPGALPRVEGASLEEDLRRRDFTVNAMIVPLDVRDRGRRQSVIAIDTALEDLGARQLRTFHASSFHDDPTRVLRAARLAPRLGFHLARSTRSQVRAALRDGVFGAVSGERLRREFERLFEDAELGLDPAEALRNLSSWYVLAALEPGLGLSRDVIAPLRRLGRWIAEPRWRGPRMRPWVAGMSLWLGGEESAVRRRTLRRLSVRGDTGDRIRDFSRDRDRRLGRLASARGRGAVDSVLAGIDEESLSGLYASADAKLRRRVERWAGEDRRQRSPVGGSDLVALGLSGPALGRALARIRAAYLDGGVANREEALALAREISRRKPRSRSSR